MAHRKRHRPAPPPAQDQRTARLRGRLGLGALLSALAHLLALSPLVVISLILGGQQAAEREQLARESVDVQWQKMDAETLPDDLPAIDPDEARPQKPKDALPTLADEKPPKPEEPKKPEEVVQVPPPEELPPLEAEKPPEVQRLHEKLVDHDNDRNDPPPDDAKYLAQKNNRAEVETRARETNLDRASKGDADASEASDRQDQEIGGQEDRIAQLEKLESQLGRRSPAKVSESRPEVQQQPQEPRDLRRSVLAMRDATPRAHELTPETAGTTLPTDRESRRRLPDHDLHSVDDLPPHAGPADRTRLRLTGKDVEYLFGDQLAADRQLAEKRSSHKQGRFSKRLGQINSALENFIPEVQPGNQTALNTRAAPFAAYLANMHRTIHELWGFGFLWDLAGKRHSDPMNNPELWTRLEIVLAGDGTVDNVKVIRTSGHTPFDVAAVDVIYSAGPYPDPPDVIRSGNGKIYLHWAFHRDERQCGTFGADYFILDNAPTGADRAGGEGQRQRGLPGDLHGPSSRNEKRERRLQALSREDGHKHGPGVGHGDEERPGAGATEESDPFEARKAESERPRSDDPLARRAAEAFFRGYVSGSASAMVKASNYPFRSGDGGVAATTSGELQSMLQGLIDEANGQRRLHSLQIYSAAGLRAATGWVPPSYATDHHLLFAVGIVGGDTMIAILGPDRGGFKVMGLIRR